MNAAMAGSSLPLLSVSGLAVRFGPQRALDGVDLAVRPGELVALAGEKGAGKTTLVRCIAGDVRPASGKIVLDGKPVSHDPLAAARLGIAVVWQDLALCDNLDIPSNLLLGRERRRFLMSGVRFRTAAASVLRSDDSPLPDTTTPVRSLPGGQRQMVAVARAMAREPRLLLLDEPTAALGVSESAQVEQLITRLRERGTTIVLACHDIDQMFRLADRIVVLRRGRVVGDVLPGEVHPDDVAALISGQQVDSSARGQLTRLHGPAGRLVPAGYVASAIERDRLLDEITVRNRVLETIREMLDTLAGPIPVASGLVIALQALRRGLQADQAALLTRVPDAPPRCRAFVTAAGGIGAGAPAALLDAAGRLLAIPRRDDVASALDVDGQRMLAVTFTAPAGPTALLAGWRNGPPTADATALMEDAAHSLRLALEREEAGFAHQEAAALRRSQELQRSLLSRLNHELRTPLTAIRGYASSLMQPDVTWDRDSQQRFLQRIAAESARLGRLVGDLLDFSAIESGVLRLQRDWCDISLVLDAAVACLPPAGAAMVEVVCDPSLPAVWADHDQLEQVFVNLLDNALGHNPPGTRVTVSAAQARQGRIVISVLDDGAGMPEEIASALFEPTRRRRSSTGGAGLGLGIVKGIVEAHGGRIELEQSAKGTCFRIHLPVEMPDKPGGRPPGHRMRASITDFAADGQDACAGGRPGGAQCLTARRTPRSRSRMTPTSST